MDFPIAAEPRLSNVVLTMSNRHTVFEGKFYPPTGSVAADYFVLVVSRRPRAMAKRVAAACSSRAPPRTATSSFATFRPANTASPL